MRFVRGIQDSGRESRNDRRGAAWTVANPETLDLQVHTSDPTKATIASKGIGVSQVTVTADADLGSGVTEITGTLDVEVKPAQAVSVGIDAGTPETKKEVNPLKKK